MEKALKRWFPIFVAPTLAAFCVGFIWPFLHGLYLSFCQFTTVDNAKWVGLGNYAKAFADTSFIDSFWFTVAFVIVATLIINVTAFAIALALTKELKGTNIFRTVFFMPNLIGGIVLGYIWQTLFNAVLMKMGEPLLALNTTAGYWGLIILLCWQQIGYMMIIYVAGLQNVPPDLMEAAAIDGANNWQTLLKVKLPMVMPSITICLFLTITNAFKLFDQNLSLTAGDPAHTTEMMALNIYYTFYARAGAAWKGIGQAKAVIFFILVVIIGLTQLRATRSKEVQQ
ncbi:MAG: sugar ABC transporter permease [Bacteroidales bacterium]|nr:ABC transporter permease subunit [Anaerotignum sp.]MCI5679789.1 sugar ABC transporter permease [Bacteroidales bacterium]MDY3927332.1 sugar ABC transporter permease [Anaerotignum sp.]